MSLQTGVGLCYELDEASGNAVDAVAGNNATLSGSSAATTGKISGARSLTGSPNYFERSVSPSAYPIAVASWLKTSDTSASFRDPIFLGNNSTADQYAGVQLNVTHKGQYSIANTIHQNAVITGRYNVNDGNWHHLLGVSRSATDHEFYIDGVTQGRSTTSVPFPTLNRFTLGAINFGGSIIQYFPGDLDQTPFWNADPSPYIYQLLNDGAGLAYTNWGTEPAVKVMRSVYAGAGLVSASTLVTTAIPVTSGDLICVFVRTSGVGVSSVVDTAGNTYTLLASYTSSDPNLSCYYAKNIAGHASNVITATLAFSQAYCWLAGVVINGCDQANPVDVYDVQTGTGTTTITTDPLTTSSPGIILAATSQGNLARYTAGSNSWLIHDSIGADTEYFGGLQQRVTTGPVTSFTPTMVSNVTQAFTAISVAFKAANAGGGGILRARGMTGGFPNRMDGGFLR